MKKSMLAAAVAAGLVLCQAGCCYAAKPTMRERVMEIFSHNPFSRFYIPPSQRARPFNPNPVMLRDGPDNAGYKAVFASAPASAGEASVVPAGEAAALAAPPQRSENGLIDEAEELRRQLEGLMEAPQQQASVTRPYYREEAPAPSRMVELLEDPSLDGRPEEEAGPDRTLLDYQAGSVYKVSAAPGFVTDVALEEGEELQRISAGDGARWQIDTFHDLAKGVWHVYLQPAQAGITTNVIIATDRRNYQLLLDTEGERLPMVAWRYPGDVGRPRPAPQVQVSVASADKLNFGYSFEKGGRAPQYVFDDGSNTYLSFDPDVIAGINPAVFTSAPGGDLLLVDYEKAGSSLVIHDVFDNLRLRIRGRDVEIKAV